jgi:pyruvate/2-oxoglutarate/acetoin dehydrogenase E1 component
VTVDGDAPPVMEYREAIRDAFDVEMARDERVLLLGEDVAAAGGQWRSCSPTSSRS